ncbi:hypothetical protein [Streptomyces sp. NPDC058542]|uniref:hypothetical protein n=1 Tax=Streptomyces sp. NPDC058542 TaxID=3346543 RepID=UPI00365F759B
MIRVGARPGDTYTVTPTRVETGTVADMAASGLDQDDLSGRKIPVYVWTTLTNHGDKPMRVREMAGDLVIRTEQGDRTKALLVMFGEAQWPNCPEPEPEKKVNQGEPEKICTTFLITREEKPAALELTQGWHSDPLEWPLKN